MALAVGILAILECCRQEFAPLLLALGPIEILLYADLKLGPPYRICLAKPFVWRLPPLLLVSTGEAQHLVAVAVVTRPRIGQDMVDLDTVVCCREHDRRDVRFPLRRCSVRAAMALLLPRLKAQEFFVVRRATEQG